MLRWAGILFLVAVFSAGLGYGGLAGEAAGTAQVLFWVFTVLCVISLFLGRRRIA